MAETITMPKLGFDMREGVLVRWVKNEGKSINKGDILAEIETDKATVEVEFSASGVVRRLLASQGDLFPSGRRLPLSGLRMRKLTINPHPALKVPLAVYKQVLNNLKKLKSKKSNHWRVDHYPS